MAFPSSNYTFNLYGADPPAYPIGAKDRPSASATASIDSMASGSTVNILNNRPGNQASTSPISIANADAIIASASGGGGASAGAGAGAGAGGGGGTGGPGSGPASAPLRKTQSMRVPSSTGTSSRAGAAAGAAIGPLSINTNTSANQEFNIASRAGFSPTSSNAPLSSSASGTAQPSFGSSLGSANPFNDLGIQIPSFRPGLSKMGRKISEFGKEVFSLDEEPSTPSRARTPSGGVAPMRVAQMGGPGLGAMSVAVAPPLTRAGTAPVVPQSVSSSLPARSSMMAPSNSNPSSATAAAKTTPYRPAPLPEEVPGMGDEPVMCPFCEKPLPPNLIVNQLAHAHVAQQQRKRESNATLVDGDGSGSGKRGVSPAGPVAGDKAATDPRPSDKAETSEEPVPKATAESFRPVVEKSEAAERAAGDGRATISKEEIDAWTRRAGLSVKRSDTNMSSLGANAKIAESTPATAPPRSAPAPEPKAFPLLPPPPPPASRFGGIFPRKSPVQKDDDESDDDDDYVASGYAKLDAPASPERVENRRLELEERKGEKREDGSGTESSPRDELKVGEERGAGDVEVTPKPMPSAQVAAGASVGVETKAETGAEMADTAELRAVLTEVLAKVDAMSKSHAELSTSHNSLLTNLKIARSNLVMAEANAEMLEEQLARAQAQAQAQAQSQARAQTKAAPAIQQPQPVRAAATAAAVPTRRSLESTRPPVPVSSFASYSKPANPAVAAAQSGGAKARPNSLIIPASALFETGPLTGPATSKPAAEAAQSGGVFGGFFAGTKKLPSSLSSLNLPTAKDLQASAVKFGDSLAMQGMPRSVTPVGHRTGEEKSTGPVSSAHPSMTTTAPSSAQFFDYHMPSPPTSHLPSPNPDTGRSPSPGAASHGPRPGLSPAHSQFAHEMAKLRTAYASSQSKMEAMVKELNDLKKGKVEMEAELETLSQALFEEANKMVADERRKRLEQEEALKEVKDEREALRETIKVLGGKLDDQAGAEAAKETKGLDIVVQVEKDQEDVDDEAWKPRDLDKHYEALRKTIHHVADGATPQTGDGSTLADAITFSGADREFEAAMDEVQAAAEAEGIVGFEPIAVNPVLGLSPVLPKTDATTGKEVNPWAKIDFSGGGGAGNQAATRRLGSRDYGYGIDPLAGPTERRESLGLNLKGVDFGQGFESPDVGIEETIEKGRQAYREQGKEETSVGMRRSSSA